MAKINKKKRYDLDIRKFHRLGVLELKKHGGLKRQNKVYGALAELSRSKKNEVFEARRFARLYDDEQLNSLCTLARDKSHPLTMHHVRELIRLADPDPKTRQRLARQRANLAQRCVNESWSVGRLRFEIACVLPRRRYSGAPQSIPESVAGKLVVTERLLRDLIRWVNVLSSPGKEGQQPPKESLPGTIPKKLDEILIQAKALEKLCAKWRGQPVKPPSKAKKKKL